MILANPGMGSALGLPPHIQEAAAASGAVRLCVPLAFCRVRRWAGLCCGSWSCCGSYTHWFLVTKMSKGSGRLWLPRRVWGEVVHNPGAGAYLEKNLKDAMSLLWPAAT